MSPQLLVDRGLYVLVKPLRGLVTVKTPSRRAEVLREYAFPLCSGAGGACWPCGGGVSGASGIASCCWSNKLAMNNPGAVNSWPLSWEKWICHTSSIFGEVKKIFIASGCAPLRVPLLVTITCGRRACERSSALTLP